MRSSTGWYRHVTLALLAAIRATTLPDAAPPVKKSPRAGVGLSPAAVRRLLWAARLRLVPALGHLLAWKRHHAWVAQRCHYRRRAALAC